MWVRDVCTCCITFTNAIDMHPKSQTLAHGVIPSNVAWIGALLTVIK
jgi:hypothetical protein